MYVCVLCDRHMCTGRPVLVLMAVALIQYMLQWLEIFTGVDSMRLVHHHVTAFDKCD